MPTNSILPDPEFTLNSVALGADEQVERQRPMERRAHRRLSLVALVLVIAMGTIAGIFWFRARETPVVAQPPPATATQPLLVRPAPEIRDPVAQLPLPNGHPVGASSAPLPALDASDNAAVDAIAGILGRKSYVALLVPNGIVRRIVVTIDNLPRKSVAQRLQPIAPVPGAFATTIGPHGMLEADNNFSRYLPYIGAAESIDSRRLVDAYLGLYPLFQQAYVELGYPDGYFNDRLINVLDHLLAAPEPTGPVRLDQPKVMFEFADSDLEDLSAGQKILVRVGIDNEMRLKAKLREIRIALTGRARTQ
jgi:hypothetical protein